MKNLRIYGNKPLNVAVIHGGPGAPGAMAPVARELSCVGGILEPLQTAITVEGQVEELKDVLENYGNIPLILIGHSWGAWLSYIVAAKHPLLIKKLILISSGPFEEKYAAKIMETRLSRLDVNEKKEALSLLSTLNSNDLTNNGFARFGELMGKADTYDSLPQNSEVFDGVDSDVYQQVWEQASRLRSSGRLLRLGERIQCPIVAIHGEYDPHPSEGVKDPLSRVIKDFRFILLDECGHCPWIERKARDVFYSILKNEI